MNERPSDDSPTIGESMNRALYLDEVRLERSVGFDGLERDLGRAFATLSAADWGRLT